MFNIDFQRKILYCLLHDTDFFKKYQTIFQSKHFEDTNCKLCCKLILKFFEKYNEIPDRTTLTQEVDNINIKSINKDDIKECIELVYSQKDKNLQFVKDSLLVFAQTQAFKEFVIQCADHITNNEVSVNKLSKMREQMDKVIHIGAQLEEIGHDYFSDDAIEERILNRKDGVRGEALTTGLPYLDYILGGGICKQELGVILAPSNRGKSLMLIHLGKAAILAGANVFHYVIEGNVKSISNRYDACFLGEYYNKLHEFNSALKERMIRIRDKYKSQLIIKKLPYASSTTIDIITHINLMQRLDGIKPDLIVIDYADVMSPSYNKYSDKRHEQSQIYKELKILLAEEMDLKVWTAAQTNRAAVNKKIVRNEDIGEDFSKVQISDIIVTLCQSEEEATHPEGEKMRLYQAKMRDNMVGRMVYLNLDKGKMFIGQDTNTQQLEDPISYEAFIKWLKAKREKDKMDRIEQVLLGDEV